MNLMFAFVFLGANAIAAPAANVFDRHEQLVAKMKEGDPEVRKLTLDVLRKKNVDYQGLATRKLQKEGEIFYRSRIEVDGVNANDNTAKFDPNLFDEPPLQPSHTAKESRFESYNKLRRWFNPTKPVDVALDIADYRSASNGKMTNRTRALFADWKNHEINEVVAHSWGCEAVYAAIVNGFMRPPKKLILTGVPDNSFVKWQLLAKHTGTRVFWVRAENDRVATDLGTRIGNNKSSAEWNLDWESYCIPKRRQPFCNSNGRTESTATKVKIGKLPSTGGHNRDEYYVALKKEGTIVGTPLDLRRAESNRKAAEIAEIERAEVEAAHLDALNLVAQARQQRKIAERDHDERLRYTKADMATRSCANPGSVTQAELNALPEPYDENLIFTPPQGLDACSYSVYMRLGRGVDAEEIRSASEPLIPARPDPPADIPSVVRPIEKPPLVNSPPRFMFSSFFPNLKDLAVKACLSPANASLTPNAIPPFSDISFAGDFDDQRAASLSFGMAECPRQLFYKLIEMIRADKGTEIDNQWLRSMASLYSAPVYVPRPWSGGDPCRDNGNERCPKP